jgi:hypothetical protein
MKRKTLEMSSLHTKALRKNRRAKEREMEGDGRSLNGLIKMSLCFCIEINQTDTNGLT